MIDFSPDEKQEIIMALVERRQGLLEWADEAEELEIDEQVNEHITLINEVIEKVENG